MSIDFLKPILGDELFAQVSEKLAGETGVDVVNALDGSYIPKAKFDSEHVKRQNLEEKVKALNAQLGESNEKLHDMEALSDKVEKLTQDVAERDGRIASMGEDYVIKDAIRGAKARDVDLVFGLLDRAKITTKDGKLNGADEQIKALKESKSFLFDADEKPNARGGYSGQQDIIGGSDDGENTNAAVNNAIRAMTGRR